MIAAIVLAAGRSERMGGPKALLAYRGTTFLGAILDTLVTAGLPHRVVVLGPDGDKVLAGHDLSGVELVRNPHPETGPIGSIRVALNTVLNQPVAGVLVWHVDRPHVSAEVVRALIARFQAGDEAIVVPSYRGKRGHPIVFGQAVFDELIEAPDSIGARAVVRVDPSRVAVVAVEDRAILEDIDTPEAYRSLLRRADPT